MSVEANELILLGEVIPLAIGAAFTPSLFALQILTTSAPKWRARSLAFFLGAASAFFLACTLLFLGFSQLPHRHQSGQDIVSGLVWLAAALVLAGMAIWLFWPHPNLAASLEKDLVARIDRAHLATFFGVAFALSIKDVTSFALLVPALHETASAQVNVVFQLVTVLVIFVIALFPVILPPAWRMFRGARAATEMAAIYRFTMDHQLTIVGVIAALFSIFCAAIGLGPNGLAVYG